MRLFTALEVPDSQRRVYRDLQSRSLEARWTPPENYHVTLRFIGDVDDEAVPALTEALSDVEAPRAPLRPYGLDALPSRDAPRVLVVGLERTDPLMALYDAVTEALTRVGVEPEDRSYRPHVTLARLDDASAGDVHRFIRSCDEAGLEPFDAGSFHLFESTLTPDGAVHEVRRSFALGT